MRKTFTPKASSFNWHACMLKKRMGEMAIGKALQKNIKECAYRLDLARARCPVG